MKDNMMLNSSHKAKRDLLTGMDYERDTSLVTQRECNYDALGRPMTRDTRYPNKAIHHADTFAYNKRGESLRGLGVGLDKSAAFAPKGENCRRLEGRLAKSDRFCPNGVRSREATPQASIDGARPSQLTGALLDENAYTYAYDDIGNREIAQEVAEGITYAANDLNQYTRISTNGKNFTPEYDADGNQTFIQTSTGIWKVQYNGQNRAVRFESRDGRTVITCGYDYMGRRFEKKVITNGTTTLHERYIYRGYLQIAAYDLRERHAEHPDLRFIIWDPTQEVATRPLAIRENGVWYTYGWDLTKNICELYGQEGFIRTIYTYSPYGQVTAEGDVTQPIQWSSEMYDAELGLVYYNFRYYNPLDGRWTRRDIEEFSSLGAMYGYLFNSPTGLIDLLGYRGQNSGTPPRYNPTNWNDEDTGGRYQRANNCYSYACDTRYDGNKINPSLRDYDGGYRPQPGEASGQGREVKVNCKDIMRRATGDGLYILHEKCCKRGYHKVALIVGLEDYHWYRQDQGGMWSHKPGIDKVRNTDALGRPISNPEKADWGSLYDTFCGYMCAPDF